MKSKNEKIICCEVKKIHKPKPKKMFKINDCFKGYNKYSYGQRKKPNYNNDINKRKSIDNFNKKKSNKLDFESISLEEIESDFMAFKAKSEALKVENELLQILLDPSNKEKSSNNLNKRMKKINPEENKYNLNFLKK